MIALPSHPYTHPLWFRFYYSPTLYILLFFFSLGRWYCHFDDDMYVNIPALVPALREEMNKSADGGVYFGRWPEEMTRSTPNGWRVSGTTRYVRAQRCIVTSSKHIHVHRSGVGILHDKNDQNK